MSALKRKTELAFAAVIATLAGIPMTTDADGNSVPSIVKGADGSDLNLDRVVVACLGGPEQPQNSGNRLYQVRVTVISSADQVEGDEDDDPEERHFANCGAVFEGLTALAAGSDINALLSAAVADFYVYEDSFNELGEDPDIQGRAWEEARIYSVYVCGRDLT